MINVSRALSLAVASIIPFFSASASVDECKSGVDYCFKISGNNITVLEFASTLFPKSIGEVLYGGGIISSTVEYIAGNIDELSRTVSIVDNVEIESTPISAYYSDSDVRNSKAYKYFKEPDSNKYMAIFDLGAIAFMNLVGYMCLALIVSSTFFRGLKIAFSTKQAGDIFNNMTLQTAMYAGLTMSLISVNGEMPMIGSLLLAAFVVGSFLSSAVTVVVAPVLIELLAYESIDSSRGVASSDETMSQVKRLIDEHSTELAKSIVLIDLVVGESVQSEIDRAPSDTLFRESFDVKEDHFINQKCLTGKYWHINLVYSDDCFDFREKLELRTGGIPAEFQGDHSTNSLKLLIDKIHSKYDVTINLTEAETLLTGIISEAYRKVIIRKELICGTSEAIKKFSTYKKDWFCGKFDYINGIYLDGQYHAEGIMDAYRYSVSDKERDGLLRTHQTSLGVELDVDATESWKVIASIIEKNAKIEKSESTKIHIVTDSILSAFYTGLTGLNNSENAELDYQKLSNNRTEGMYTIISSIMPLMEVDVTGTYEVLKSDYFCFIDCGLEIQNNKRVTFNHIEAYLNVEQDVVELLLSQLAGFVENSPKDVVDISVATICPGYLYSQDLFTSIEKLSTCGLNYHTIGQFGVHFVTKSKEKSIARNNPAITASEARELARRSIPNVLKKSIDIVGLVVVASFVFGVVSFSVSFMFITIVGLTRLAIHVIFLPIYILAFVWSNNDHEQDESNILIPEAVKEVLQRTLVEPLALSSSFLIGIIVCLLSHKISIVLIHELLKTTSKDSSILGLFSTSLELVVSILAAVYILIKGSEFVTYSYKKIIEFLDDGISLDESGSDKMVNNLKESLTRNLGTL